MSLFEIRARLKVCKEKCNLFRKHKQKYRTRHLKRRLELAKGKGDEETEVRILAIIKGEKDRAYWMKLNFGMAKPLGQSARMVSESSDDGKVTEFEGQSVVEEAILSRIHDHWFYLPEQAPVCQ
jgi:hypothetical protein